MKYNRFEDLPVWNSAIELAIKVYELTAKPEFRNRYSLRDQLERAAVSISNNIAEGFERGTNQELLTFLYIARGSAGEVRSMLGLLERVDGFADFKSQISNSKSLAEEIARQLHGWADFLQNSKIKGQRYLTEKSRRSFKAIQDREEFLEQLRASTQNPTESKA
ncbi:MAG TPA: four helix bundle protein [Candidatus Acidoferrales bacterium]|nr:four helix bundle protein [Candidatus Acidoferrales bacterium]